MRVGERLLQSLEQRRRPWPAEDYARECSAIRSRVPPAMDVVARELLSVEREPYRASSIVGQAEKPRRPAAIFSKKWESYFAMLMPRSCHKADIISQTETGHPPRLGCYAPAAMQVFFPLHGYFVSCRGATLPCFSALEMCDPDRD